MRWQLPIWRLERRCLFFPGPAGIHNVTSVGEPLLREHIASKLRPTVNISSQDDLRPTIGDHDLDPFMQDWVDSDERLKPAAVLVPLVEHHSGLTVLLTKRTDHLHHHAGQISFPGGRVEEDDLDIVDTALRETEEEIGLDLS